MEVEAEFIQVAYICEGINVNPNTNMHDNINMDLDFNMDFNLDSNLPISTIVTITPTYTKQNKIKNVELFSICFLCKSLSFSLLCIIGIMSITILYNALH